MSKDKCMCGADAVDHIVLTNKSGKELKVGFCEAHREEAEKAVQMLLSSGMNEL